MCFIAVCQSFCLYNCLSDRIFVRLIIGQLLRSYGQFVLDLFSCCLMYLQIPVWKILVLPPGDPQGQAVVSNSRLKYHANISFHVQSQGCGFGCFGRIRILKKVRSGSVINKKGRKGHNTKSHNPGSNFSRRLDPDQLHVDAQPLCKAGIRIHIL